jgi:hypothetical protein
VVLLGEDELSGRLCRLAATAGAKVLYFQAEIFDASTDPYLNIGREGRSGQGSFVSNPLAELQRAAERFDGLRKLELVFVAGGVLTLVQNAKGQADHRRRDRQGELGA